MGNLINTEALERPIAENNEASGELVALNCQGHLGSGIAPGITSAEATGEKMTNIDVIPAISHGSIAIEAQQELPYPWQKCSSGYITSPAVG